MASKNIHAQRYVLYQSILVRIGCKHLFKISCTDVAISRHTHTLQANGDYDKKAWLNAFKSVVPVLCSASSKSTQVWQNLLNSSIVLLTFVTIFIHDCCDAECCSVARGLMGGKAQGFMHGMIFYSFWKKSRHAVGLASSPGAPIFSTAREKLGPRGSLVNKTYHVRDVRWNRLPYMAQQQVGRLEAQNISPKVRAFRYNQLWISKPGPFSPFAGCQKPRFAW